MDVILFEDRVEVHPVFGDGLPGLEEFQNIFYLFLYLRNATLIVLSKGRLHQSGHFHLAVLVNEQVLVDVVEDVEAVFELRILQDACVHVCLDTI